MAMTGYHVVLLALGYLAGTTLTLAPLAVLYGIYLWDRVTWEDRVEQYRIARGDRLWRDTPEQRALADRAGLDMRHTPLDTAGLPPAAPVERDPLTQPEMARAVSLRHPDRPVTLPARRPLLARLGHWRTAC